MITCPLCNNSAEQCKVFKEILYVCNCTGTYKEINLIKNNQKLYKGIVYDVPSYRNENVLGVIKCIDNEDEIYAFSPKDYKTLKKGDRVSFNAVDLEVTNSLDIKKAINIKLI